MEQHENLRKSNTERLRVMAARLGEVEDDEIASMDRPTLIQVVAQGLLTKKDSDQVASGRRESHKSERSKELELQVQLKRMEMEEKRMDQKRVEQEMEHRRLEKEMEQKLFEQEREDRRFEMEREDIGQKKGTCCTVFALHLVPCQKSGKVRVALYLVPYRKSTTA